jgi:hypothetical protein
MWQWSLCKQLIYFLNINKMSSKTKKILIAIIILVLFFAAIIIFWNFYAKSVWKKHETEKINATYTSIFKTLLAGEAGKAAKEYEEAIKEAQSKKIKSSINRAFMQLAIAEEKNGEYEKSLYNYKKVINNEKISPMLRSISLTHVAELALVLPDDLLKKKFFNSGSSATYFFEKDPFATQYRILTLADGLWPTAPAAYELANLMSEKLVEDKLTGNLSESERVILQNQFPREVVKAKSTFDKVKPDEWDADRLLMCKLSKARIGGDLIKIGNSAFDSLILSEAEIENLFKESLELSKESFASLGPENYGYFTRLYYASFLNDTYNGTRDEDIRNILAPIYDSKNVKKAGFFVFLQKERNYPDSAYHKQKIMALSKIDARLATLLKDAGW